MVNWYDIWSWEHSNMADFDILKGPIKCKNLQLSKNLMKLDTYKYHEQGLSSSIRNHAWNNIIHYTYILQITAPGLNFNLWLSLLVDMFCYNYTDPIILWQYYKIQLKIYIWNVQNLYLIIFKQHLNLSRILKVKFWQHVLILSGYF